MNLPHLLLLGFRTSTAIGKEGVRVYLVSGPWSPGSFQPRGCPVWGPPAQAVCRWHVPPDAGCRWCTLGDRLTGTKAAQPCGFSVPCIFVAVDASSRRQVGFRAHRPCVYSGSVFSGNHWGGGHGRLFNSNLNFCQFSSCTKLQLCPSPRCHRVRTRPPWTLCPVAEA